VNKQLAQGCNPVGPGLEPRISWSESESVNHYAIESRIVSYHILSYCSTTLMWIVVNILQHTTAKWKNESRIIARSSPLSTFQRSSLVNNINPTVNNSQSELSN